MPGYPSRVRHLGLTPFGLTEFFRTVANYSDLHQIYRSDGYSVLGPSGPPIKLDFQASSFASKTTCRVVTGLCDAKPTPGQSLAPLENFNFVCNASTAGLNMTGNFLNLLAPLNASGLTTGPEVGHTDNEQLILGANSITRNGQGIGFQYFHDSQKQRQVQSFESPYQTRDELYWAAVWRTPFTSLLTWESPLRLGAKQPPANETAAVGIPDHYKGGAYGILSCETSLREVVSFSACLSLMPLLT